MKTISKPYIVLIDDNSHGPQNRVLVDFLTDLYGSDRVRLFDDPTEGVQFIKDNLSERIIVLLDMIFNGESKGFGIFKQITNESSLVCVIIMTGIIEYVDQTELKEFINNHAWYLITRDTPARDILKIVKRADEHLLMQIDGAIEQWILRHNPADQQKPFIKSRNGKSYTLLDILRSIRTGNDPIGQEIAGDILQLAITMISEDESLIGD